MHITTLTGNLLAEWTYHIDDLVAGATHRAESSSFQVGGKGINVARILNRLGIEATALAFAEGGIGDLCSQWLAREGIHHQIFPLAAEVRTGLVVRTKAGTETTFLGQDPPVPQNSWLAAMNSVRSGPASWLAVCGSIPGWKENWQQEVASLLSGGDIHVAVDTYGPPLNALTRLPLDLVKINRSELNRLYPWAENQPLTDVLVRLNRESPVQNWIITDGANPIMASLYQSGVHQVTPAKIREVSPTGSGDTFLAALLSKWDAGFTNALAFAAACATANAASEHIGDFELPPPGHFYPEITQAGSWPI